MAVLFIHGFRKNHDDWDTTEHGKSIGIATQIAKRCTVVCAGLDDSDYCQSTLSVATEMSTQLAEPDMFGDDKKVTVVAHSNGCFYAIQLAQLDPNRFGRLLLIDPTLKSEAYRQQLLERVAADSTDVVSQRKLENFDSLPTSVPNRVVVRIHFNYTEAMSPDRVRQLHDLVKTNVKSRLIAHYDASHMIHYKMPHVIVDSIHELACC